MQTTVTWYEVLELAESASQADIERAYRRLRKRWHPDLNPDGVAEATERFKRIQLAWEELGDPGRRARYDDELRAQREPGEPEPAAWEPEPRPWWEPEHPQTFASTTRSTDAPQGYPTGPDVPASGSASSEGPAEERGRSPLSTSLGVLPMPLQRLVTMRVDGLSATLAILAAVAGFGVFWWPYALLRRRRERPYVAGACVVVALAVLSVGSGLAGTLYWLVSIGFVAALIRSRRHPHPAFGGGAT